MATNKVIFSNKFDDEDDELYIDEDEDEEEEEEEEEEFMILEPRKKSTRPRTLSFRQKRKISEPIMKKPGRTNSSGEFDKKTLRPPPAIKCSTSSSYILSEPCTPINGSGGSGNGGVAASWTEGTGRYFIRPPPPHPSSSHHSSISSVNEELFDDIEDDNNKNKKRSSSQKLIKPIAILNKKKASKKGRLNLSGESNLSTSSSPLRSPRNIPKFLRNSFSRLLNRNSESESSPPPPKSSEDDSGSFKRVSTLENLIIGNVVGSPSPEVMTPSTRHFIEETQNEGLPLIPFAYPTSFIVEKLKAKESSEAKKEEEEITKKDEKKCDTTNRDEDNEDEDNEVEIDYARVSYQPTLENLVRIAENELLREESSRQSSSTRRNHRQQEEFDLEFPFPLSFPGSTTELNNLISSSSREESPEYLDMSSSSRRASRLHHYESSPIAVSTP